MKLSNVIGGLGIILGIFLISMPGIAPCDVGVGRCGDSWMPIAGLVLLIIGVIGIWKGKKSSQ